MSVSKNDTPYRMKSVAAEEGESEEKEEIKMGIRKKKFSLNQIFQNNCDVSRNLGLLHNNCKEV